MSKIKINEIESYTSNADLQVTPNGTGIFEVAGDGDDGTLQLDSSSQTNNVKIKSPNDTAGQSYTMILPENDITADKFLQVGTVTGSGATAVGQLQQATITPQDGTQLNASNVTSGTLPPDRVGDLPASAGFGLKLISKATVAQDDTVQAISFTNFDDGGLYRIMLKNVLIKLISSKDYSTYYSSGATHTPRAYFLDANGQKQNNIQYADFGATGVPYLYGSVNSGYVDLGDTQDTAITVNSVNIYNPIHPFFNEIELYSKAQYGYMRCRGWSSQYKQLSCSSFNPDYTTTKRIHGLQINASTRGDFYYAQGSEILLYKYVES